MRIAIFGVHGYGMRLARYLLLQKENVVVFLDNNSRSYPTGVSVETVDMSTINLPVAPPQETARFDPDLIIISNRNEQHRDEIKTQLAGLGFPEENISFLFEDTKLLAETLNSPLYGEADPRIRWIKDFSTYACQKNMSGNVAECGVFLGDTAYWINEYFSQKKMYLFDTFQGFAEVDLNIERNFQEKGFLNSKYNQEKMFAGYKDIFDILENKLPYYKQCILKQGIFPKSATGLHERFCFVNLDMDLYQPMIEGLRFFYSRMVPGGVILLHDYFNDNLPGVKRALADFEKEKGQLACMPIGDGLSMAIVVGDNVTAGVV